MEDQQIGPYFLVKKLGKGGFGEVWLAEKRTELVTKKVALKLPLDDQINLATVKNEATLWEKASGHPNVLPIIDADIYDGQVVVVSEYADGGSLSNWLKKYGGKSPSIEKSVDLMIGILSGLIHLHSHKITHRDLKPSNILLHGDIPRITDFGISRVVEHSSKGTEALGTPIYMSPESFRKSTSPKTDIWSAGVVFYELLSGKYPFFDEDVFALMDAIRSEEPIPLEEEIPEDLKKIVEKALQKNPNERFQLASEMRQALLNFKQSIEQKKSSVKSTVNLDNVSKSELKTQKIELFDAATVPLKKEFDESIETQPSLSKRKKVLPVFPVAVSLILLIVIGGSVFWWIGIKDKSKENQPFQQVGNNVENKTVEVIPTPPPIIPPNTSVNAKIKSTEKKVVPTPIIRDKVLPTPQPKITATPQIEKPRPKPSPKKTVEFEDLLK